MYFPRMKNFSSFHRQLNMYDFQRVEKEKGIYSHPLFVRNRPELAVFMKAIRSKKNNSASTNNGNVNLNNNNNDVVIFDAHRFDVETFNNNFNNSLNSLSTN